jgi:hypothetical protein
MEATDFFQTAELLKTHANEAHLRTSIGRSFYATFLYFREYLRKLGLEKKKNPNREAQVFVINCLGFSGIQEATKVSAYLHDLQQLREDADYDLIQEYVQNTAEDALVLGRKTIADYMNKITPQNEEILLRNASDYAKRKDWI